MTLPSFDLSQIEAVFFDIDDTFSSESKILPEAYQALWNLYRAGFKVVPVTGRPAGWCDMIARMWPVSAVVGENGAFYSYMEGRLVKSYLESRAVRENNARKLRTLHRKILKKFPSAKTPSDQAFREFDLAIDYCEDVKPWPRKKVEDLLSYSHLQGANAKLSSIHVNIWFGRYDKWSCVKKVLKERFKMNPTAGPTGDLHKVVYLGDSPNDEPFFEHLPYTVGVANVRGFLDRMKHHPKYITENPGGLGFAEFAQTLLESPIHP